MSRLRPSTAVLVAAILAFVSSCAVVFASAGKGEVGGPPTLALGPPDEGSKASPALVIGVGSALHRTVELVAYAWKPPADLAGEGDFCIWAEQPPKEVEYGTCASALSGASPIAIDMQTQLLLAPKRAQFTAIGGRIAPEVAAVRLYFHRHGSRKRLRVYAIIGRVAGDLQRKLKQPAPFGFFYAKVRGLVRFSAFKAQALDPSGNVIGTAGNIPQRRWINVSVLNYSGMGSPTLP
jgi:hypothetical protein